VDGSYVTGKAEPNDIDLLLISVRYNELSVQQYLDRVCPVEAVSAHLYVEPQLPSPMLDFFTTTRRGTAKGIIQEQRLVEALASGDKTLIEARRFELLHVLADRQAIIDAIKQYEQHVSQSA
jgi:hypothetical protein